MGRVKYIKEKTKKTSISLTPYYQDIIAREMASGKYKSVNQLISYALLQVERESLLLEKVKRSSKN